MYLDETAVRELLDPQEYLAAVRAAPTAVGAPRPARRELDDAAMDARVVTDERHAAETRPGDVILSGARIVFRSPGQAVEDAVAAERVGEAPQARPG